MPEHTRPAQQQYRDTPTELTPQRITAFNRLVLDGLELQEDVTPGELRRYSVEVGRYLAAPAEDCEYLLERLCAWLNSDNFEHPDMGTALAILKAVIAHLYIAWIHPFGDGNGRTARLIEFQILVASGVPSPAAHLLSNHYNTTRAEYYRQLDRASRSGGDVMSFLLYAVRGLVEGLHEQLKIVRQHQWDLAWREFVYSYFRDKDSARAGRRRSLVLDLSTQAAPVPVSKLRDISAKVAKLYTDKTDRTLWRDVEELEQQGFIRREGGGYVAAKETILAFLPPKRQRSESSSREGVNPIAR